ncbi:hypothetical protein ACRTDU_02745 [Sunxiuqinia elliptica]
MKKQILCTVFIMLVSGLAGVVLAQENEDYTAKNNFRWGLNLTESYDGISQAGGNRWFFIDTWRRSVFTIGGFIEFNKTELNLNAGYNYVGGELNYKFYRTWTAIVGGSFGEHGMRLELENTSNYYDYYDGDLNLGQYYLGIGYHNILWQRLKLQANAKTGAVQTGKVTVSGIVNSSPNSEANKKAQKIDTYELEPSLMYGGNIYLEVLPRPWKMRKNPLVPFINVSVMGNRRSNAKREVSIEEWVPGNVVYHEKSADLDFDLVSVQVQLGLKWYLKF